MINLLSEERKGEIRAARTNVILSRYIIILILATVFIIGVLSVSYTLLLQTKSSADARVESNTSRVSVYSDTQKEIDTLSSKLSDAKNILNQEIRYSSVLTSIGKLMPAGTLLDSLELNETRLSGTTAVDLTAYAKTNESAAVIQQRLQNSPLFTQVSLKGTDTENGIENYPVKINLTVVFNRSGL